MKRTVLVLVVLLAAGRLTAQMAAGAVVKEGSAFPVVVDLNYDGLDDLIQGRTVLFNNGGSFSAPVALPLEGADQVVEVLDANGDHRPDLLTQDASVYGAPPHYRLYLATGDGGFTPVNNSLPTQTPPYVADFDGDGVDDIILTNDVFKGMVRVATDLTLLRSDARGSFYRLNTYRLPLVVQGALQTYRILAGDLNHDGNPDLVIRCADDLVVMRGTGGGAFEIETRYLPAPFGYTAKALADIDGDGNLDFVLAEGREVLAFLGDGRGNFPRFATGAIEKKHDMAPSIIRESSQQPRDIAIGNFTASHPQIALGTNEGDVVILEYRDGVLAEAARNLTEFLAVSVRAGSFVSPGHSDIEASGTGTSMNGTPRLLIGREKVAPASAPRAAARLRSIRDTSPANVRYNVTTRGGCASNETAWTLRHEGMFNQGSSTEGGKVEAFIKGDWLWYRMNVPYSSDPVAGILVRHGDTYSGEVAVKTAACDWQIVSISAALDH